MTLEEVKEFEGFLEKYDRVSIDVCWDVVSLEPKEYKTSDIHLIKGKFAKSWILEIEANGDYYSNLPYGVDYVRIDENSCSFYFNEGNFTDFTFYNADQN